jgi:serine/threonine protein phosphatase PrpC
MSNRWYYAHEGQTHGPATAAELRRLVTAGRLAPDDPVWAEGEPPATAIPLEAALPLQASEGPAPPGPDWLRDVSRAEAPAPRGPVKPDWLEDVRQAANDPAPPAGTSAPAPAAGSPEKADAANTRSPRAAPRPLTRRAAEPAPQPPRVPKADDPCRLAVGGATSRGMVRDHNEDSFLVLQASSANLNRRQEVAAIVVADGMGGHKAGEVASGLVIGAVAKVLGPLLGQAASGPAVADRAAVMAEAIGRALEEANRTVLEAATADPACKGMGATAAVVLAWNGEAHIGLVGDCRVYHQRAGKLTQVTKDQSIVARMVQLGQLTDEEAAGHPRRNEVSQAVGQRASVEPAHYDLLLAPGDWLVVACDGLYAHVDGPVLQEAINRADSSPASLAGSLVDLANQGGGSDNCTVVAVSCS